jgi:hypothetical protein
MIKANVVNPSATAREMMAASVGFRGVMLLLALDDGSRQCSVRDSGSISRLPICPTQSRKSNALDCFIKKQVIVLCERDRCTAMNPDSAVVIDRKREAQSFRSEVDAFLPLSRHRSAVLRRDVQDS